MKTTGVTLCFPGGEKSCFACCPPIRPAGYEHILYRTAVRRILRENNEAFKKDTEGISPITGFSCWALGYIDENHRLVGCLLHPAQNRGVDLRFKIDYGEKCQREICPEAKTFSGLGLKEKKFWLQLADGLDSFSYSSRKFNPLFKIMDWGGDLLSQIASIEDYRVFTRESFFQSYPFFSTINRPKANAYLVKWLLSREDIQILKSKTFTVEFEKFSGRISIRLSGVVPRASEGSHAHLLDFDRDFLDFLRLSARIIKIKMEDAVVLKKMVDDELEKFRQSIPKTGRNGKRNHKPYK
ncbi:MAG: hypothetical protein JSW15_05315 [Deltaproteobacteria bacterium]|nr:MAG: hypothetical protein JSW15_05315 [Deltaproteobacteria bacterium]